MLNAMTIDVEDYFHVTAFENQVERHSWDKYPSRVEANTRRLLEMLARRQVRATFFVLGWIAKHFPGLVREIDAAGHEIGSHSYWHRLIYHMSPDEFRTDLRDSRNVLEDIIGKPVTAFRAPSYSGVRKTLWALEVLAEEGFCHDSSIFPVHHDRYGIADAERRPHLVAGKVWEYPPSVWRLWRVNVPVAGGGYFRLFPARWTAFCIRSLNRQGLPFLFYIHPWELDPEQPRLPCRLTTRCRHYVNLAASAGKLERLLDEFRFGRLTESLEAFLASPACGVALATRDDRDAASRDGPSSLRPDTSDCA